MGRRSSDPEKLPPNVTAYMDRHGKRRYRYRKHGYRQYHFKDHPGTPRHPSAEYKAVVAGERVVVSNAPAGTIRDLVNRYYSSASFRNPSAVTQEKVRARLEEFCRAHGPKRAATLRFNHVETILAEKSKRRVSYAGRIIGGPNAAKSLQKDLIRVFDLAVRLEWIRTNPVRLANGVKVPKTGGFHTWTEDEIKQYRAHFPLGTMGRLAIEIILWTLLRRGDASRFGPQHRTKGKIRVWNQKTKKYSWLPEPPQLTAAIEAMENAEAETYLLTVWGKPFASPAAFGNWFRRRCDEAGLPHCSAHGLRKATARRLADLGATQQELKAAGNWSHDKDVAIYTAAADQRRLATQALTDLATREAELQPKRPGV
ncbi:MAG: tyrosine-type recombinase/integrase [Alphaproteobacteria bacterium]